MNIEIELQNRLVGQFLKYTYVDLWIINLLRISELYE